MTEENKPFESDTDADENTDDIFSEDDQDSTSEEVGVNKDVDAAKEFLTKVSTIAGREFKSIDEYEKHYKNLSSYVGKKTVDNDTQPQKNTSTKKVENDSLREVLESNKKIEFFLDNPEAKKHFAEYIKPLADGSGVSYAEAWEKVRPLIQSSEEQEKEKEIGVNSKTRIQTVDSSKLKSLAQQARKGNDAAQDELIAKMLGLEK